MYVFPICCLHCALNGCLIFRLFFLSFDQIHQIINKKYLGYVEIFLSLFLCINFLHFSIICSIEFSEVWFQLQFLLSGCTTSYIFCLLLLPLHLIPGIIRWELLLLEHHLIGITIERINKHSRWWSSEYRLRSKLITNWSYPTIHHRSNVILSTNKSLWLLLLLLWLELLLLLTNKGICRVESSAIVRIRCLIVTIVAIILVEIVIILIAIKVVVIVSVVVVIVIPRIGIWIFDMLLSRWINSIIEIPSTFCRLITTTTFIIAVWFASQFQFLLLPFLLIRSLVIACTFRFLLRLLQYLRLIILTLSTIIRRSRNKCRRRSLCVCSFEWCDNRNRRAVSILTVLASTVDLTVC